MTRHILSTPVQRRLVLTVGAATAAGALLSACAPMTTNTPAADATRPPIVFVHGNGDTAGLWLTTQWRFESSGWPRNRLFALDVPYPSARDDDTKPQATRTSTTEHMQALAAEVDRVKRVTGADKVILVANSRGGNAVRNYLQNGGGVQHVSHAVLGGTPNHGVWASDRNPNSEFNGNGPFLKALNTPRGANGDEITPGVRWMTLRSDNNDKFAQPDGVWIGQKGTPTNVTFDGPALKGALNTVLPGVDHRETSYSPQAFAATWQFVTGAKPSVGASTAYIVQEPNLVLNGKLTQLGANGVGADATNISLPGASIEVFAVDANTGARLGAAVHRKTISASEGWGPFTAKAGTAYEFVVSAPGYATTHVYRAPFPRSTDLLNFRMARVVDADKTAEAVFTMIRPRGYFTRGKDTMSFDGKLPPGVPEGVGGVATSKISLPAGTTRPITGVFGGERITAAAWPAAQGHTSVIEIHE
jgi:triacylglycerol lipase